MSTATAIIRIISDIPVSLEVRPSLVPFENNSLIRFYSIVTDTVVSGLVLPSKSA